MSARLPSEVFAKASTIIESGGGEKPRIVITFPDLDAAHVAAVLLTAFMGRRETPAYCVDAPGAAGPADAVAGTFVPHALWLDWERLIAQLGDGQFDEPTTISPSAIIRVREAMSKVAVRDATLADPGAGRAAAQRRDEDGFVCEWDGDDASGTDSFSISWDKGARWIIVQRDGQILVGESPVSTSLARKTSWTALRAPPDRGEGAALPGVTELKLRAALVRLYRVWGECDELPVELETALAAVEDVALVDALSLDADEAERLAACGTAPEGDGLTISDAEAPIGTISDGPEQKSSGAASQAAPAAGSGLRTPKVQRIETVTPESGYQEAGAPYWRVVIGPEARCFDFDDEAQAHLLVKAVGEALAAAAGGGGAGDDKVGAPWECFCDEAYFGLWAVRPIGEQKWGHCFHLNSEAEARGLVELLSGKKATPAPQVRS